MKFLLLVPDGVGIRNFLCSQFIELLAQDGEVVIWHGTPKLEFPGWRNGAVRWLPLPEFREGIPERILRRAKVYGQLYGQREQGGEVMLDWIRPSGRLLSRFIGHAAQAVGWLCSGRQGLRLLERLHAEATVRSTYIRQFEDALAHEAPDLVFCTHQRSSRAVPAMLAARRLQIPTATFIYSWDNLPKGRMAVQADHFLVWSESMKDDLLRYYPEVASARVHAVGTPQFEHYFDPSLVEPRGVFLRSLGLDPDRPVVCFSGCDLSTSPHDPIYLRDLAEALRTFAPQERPQLLFRPCPADTSDRYCEVLADYPEIALSKPLWSSHTDGDWTQLIPNKRDVALLVNVVQHCDLAVNVGSTVAMDFAILDKPAVFVAYDPKDAKRVRGWSVSAIYRLPHFRSVHELDPVYWATSPDKLAPVVRHALSHPEEKSQARQNWLRRHVMLPLERSSERCYQALNEVSGRPIAAADAACVSSSLMH